MITDSSVSQPELFGEASDSSVDTTEQTELVDARAELGFASLRRKPGLRGNPLLTYRADPAPDDTEDDFRLGKPENQQPATPEFIARIFAETRKSLARL